MVCLAGLAIIAIIIVSLIRSASTPRPPPPIIKTVVARPDPNMQNVVSQLDRQRVQAQMEVNRLQQQLSESSSYTAAQMKSMQEEMARLQQNIKQAENEKLEMQDELEKAKSTTVVHNITYNIQDSAIAGDINATGLKEKDD